MTDRMKLPRAVEAIISRLESSGHTAYVVGGSVRDAILGREVNDFDLTTSATPEEIKTCFSSERTIDTGILHGTVTLLQDGEPYEITTYRVDGEYLDGRHPTEVRFTDNIKLDLARRDFTVNAIAYNPRLGFVDPYSGIRDAELGVIRAVGSAAQRFDEDALRILRALRFSAVLGFGIDAETAAAVRAKAHLLERVSRERILVELRKLFGGVAAPAVISEYSEIIAALLPPLTKITLPEAEPSVCGWFSYLLAIFALSSDNPSEAFNSAMHSLRSDNNTRLLGKNTLLALPSAIAARSDRDIRTLLRDFGENAVREALALAYVLGHSAPAPRSVDSIIERGLAFKLSDLRVTGADIIALGGRGPEIGRLLSHLLDAVINGELENERSALIERAAELLSAAN